MPVGRRGCILLGDLLVVVGGILQATSWSVAQIIVGRVICVRIHPSSDHQYMLIY